MLDFNFKKYGKKLLNIYFIAVILIPETRQEKGELCIALFADQLTAGA